MALRDHTFLGITQSLCPECLKLVRAKIIVRQGRVYFRKECPEHGTRDDYICSDVSQYDRMEYTVPGRFPEKFGIEPDKGCPFDCGLCTEHEQHTCLGLVEITSSCNLTCPMCYAGSAPGGKHLSVQECRKSIDRLVEVEGRPEVLQLSGGEPTLHPQFEEIFNYACSQPIDCVMVNTNGIRLAHDRALLDLLASHKKCLEVYLQFDGFEDRTHTLLRGEPLASIKLKAIDELGKRGIRTILVATLQPDVNMHELGKIIQFGLERPWITGISLQPATYSGRFVLPEMLEKRVTFPDVIQAIEEQTQGMFRRDDFMPLPCAHPNCHSLAYAYRSGGEVVSLMRFIDARNHLDLLANGIAFNKPGARKMMEQYLSRIGGCCGGSCEGEPSIDNDSSGTVQMPILNGSANGNNGSCEIGSSCRGEASTSPISIRAADASGMEKLAAEFFSKALGEKLAQADVFRITITSFLDAYNFDVRRVMKCCIHHILPSGHVIPFCAYNVLYRPGHVPLPALTQFAVAKA